MDSKGLANWYHTKTQKWGGPFHFLATVTQGKPSPLGKIAALVGVRFHWMAENERLFKICLLGDGAVGKTSLRKRYMGEGFSGGYMTTLGVDFALHKTTIDDVEITWQIWDLAGQPDMSEVRIGYYNGSYGAIAVYDVTRPYTADSIDKWIRDFRANSYPRCPCILVGNKIDLRSQISSSMDTKKGKKLSAELGLPLLETSAKSGEGVREAFENLGKAVLNFTDQLEKLD
jgi:small GTP-binding protein